MHRENLFISFIFIDVNVYRLKYEKDWVIERIIYYVRLCKKKARGRDIGIINARMGEKKTSDIADSLALVGSQGLDKVDTMEIRTKRLISII